MRKMRTSWRKSVKRGTLTLEILRGALELKQICRHPLHHRSPPFAFSWIVVVHPPLVSFFQPYCFVGQRLGEKENRVRESGSMRRKENFGSKKKIGEKKSVKVVEL